MFSVRWTRLTPLLLVLATCLLALILVHSPRQVKTMLPMGGKGQAQPTNLPPGPSDGEFLSAQENDLEWRRTHVATLVRGIRPWDAKPPYTQQIEHIVREIEKTDGFLEILLELYQGEQGYSENKRAVFFCLFHLHGPSLKDFFLQVFQAERDYELQMHSLLKLGEMRALEIIPIVEDIIWGGTGLSTLWESGIRALGAMQHPLSVDLLKRAMTDPELGTIIPFHAARALGRNATEEIARSIVDDWDRSSPEKLDTTFHPTQISGLQSFGMNKNTVITEKIFQEYLDRTCDQNKRNCFIAYTLQYAPPEFALKMIRKLTSSGNKHDREQANLALFNVESPGVVRILIEQITMETEEHIRQNLALTLSSKDMIDQECYEEIKRALLAPGGAMTKLFIAAHLSCYTDLLRGDPETTGNLETICKEYLPRDEARFTSMAASQKIELIKSVQILLGVAEFIPDGKKTILQIFDIAKKHFGSLLNSKFFAKLASFNNDAETISRMRDLSCEEGADESLRESALNVLKMIGPTIFIETCKALVSDETEMSIFQIAVEELSNIKEMIEFLKKRAQCLNDGDKVDLIFDYLGE